MASAQFLEEALSTAVDESAVNAIVGSLENQLVTSKHSGPVRSVPEHNQAATSSIDRYGRMSYTGEMVPEHYGGGVGTDNTSAGEKLMLYPQPSQYGSSVPISVGNLVTFPNGGQGVGQSVLHPAIVQPMNRPTVLQQPHSSGMHNIVSFAKQPVLSNMRLVNVTPHNAPINIQKPVPTGHPRLMLSASQVRAASSGITMQTLPGLQPSHQGHLLLKTENGQYQLLRVGPGPMQPSTTARLSAMPAVSRITTKRTLHALAPAVTSWSQSLPQMSTRPHPLQLSQPSVSSHVPSPSTLMDIYPQPSQSAVSQKSSDVKEKCRNFLANLLDLSSKEPKSVELNVQHLIQELIDGQVEPERFCDRLENLLNASPQQCLIGFLKKSLPLLRQSLVANELTIVGIRPPPAHVAFSSGLSASLTARHPLNPATSAPILPKPSSSGVNNYPPQIQAQKLSKNAGRTHPVTAVSGNSRSPYQRPSTSKSLLRDREKRSTMSYPQFYSDQTGIDAATNNLTVMGGVHIDASQQQPHTSENIEVQLMPPRHYLIPFHVMQARIKTISQRHGLAEPGPEVAGLISNAAEEYVKRLLVKLVGITSHRLRNQSHPLENDPRYEVSQDVKGQLKFLEELDQVDQKRRMDSEREMLLRAAKSRSKNEDPEQAKLKAKAKEMQRVEMEELRQREANVTALQAIGPRKKPRLESASDAGASTSAASNAAFNMAGPSGQATVRPRVKRTVMRDLCFLMENEKHLAHSVHLFRAYLK